MNVNLRVVQNWWVLSTCFCFRNYGLARLRGNESRPSLSLFEFNHGNGSKVKWKMITWQGWRIITPICFDLPHTEPYIPQICNMLWKGLPETNQNSCENGLFTPQKEAGSSSSPIHFQTALAIKTACVILVPLPNPCPRWLKSDSFKVGPKNQVYMELWDPYS